MPHRCPVLPQEPYVEPFLERLKRRKIFQWALAYLAAGWLAAQVLNVLAEPWGLSGGLERTAQALLALGFPVVLVLAWYHGEKGRQRVSGPEFVILTSLVLLAGTALAVFNPMQELPVDPATVVALRDLGPNSIVVLPFQDMSFDGDQEYMSDGIAEELLTMLMTIPEMTVISRTTAFSFKDAGLTVREIADELGVAHVLEGSVRKAGNTIRITAQLTDPRTDAQLFSETFDRALEDIFAIQEDIAAKVVSGLRVTILGELPTLRETNPQAYTLFLQARKIADAVSPENYETAIPMFERVLEIDPDYAPAHLELAIAYHDMAGHGWMPFEEGFQMATDAAERALSLDPDFATAWAVLGSNLAWMGDLAGGARHTERALEMDPDHPDVLMGAANFLAVFLARFDEAIPLYEYVRDRDPVYLVNLGNLASAYFYSGRWDDAAEVFRTISALDPSSVAASMMITLSLVEMGELEEALGVAESLPVPPFPPFRLIAVGAASHALGQQAESELALQELRDEWGGAVPSYVAAMYAYRGDANAAFEWLDRVTPETPEGLPATFLPHFSSLHDDPRWTAYRERMGQSEDELGAIEFEVTLPGRN
jgi:adenylate cyclase